MTFNYPYAVTEGLAIYAGGVGIGLSYTKTLTTNLTVSSLVFDATARMFDNGISKGSSTTIGTQSISGLIVGSMYNNTRYFNGDIAE
jgi:hypothetical protein